MHCHSRRKGQVGIAGIGDPCRESARARVERRTGSSMMPLRAAGLLLIGLATAGCTPPSTPPPQTVGVTAPPSSTATSAPTPSAVPTPAPSPPANPGTVTVTVALFEQFT